MSPEHHTGCSLLLIEAGLTVVAVLLAFCWPDAGCKYILWLQKLFARLARHRSMAVLIVTGAAFVSRLLILPLSPIPDPAIHDDFSFLLAADTFSSGRLTNPTHPMWTHFESFHITWKPSYMSMYFPAQGMVLAAGKLLAGHPWYGVLGSAALMCGAICWMLQGWLPPGWALLGGMLATLRLALFSYWIDSYCGGAVAAIGGALVLGALPRLWRKFRTRDFAWMALGMALLANSRPYEGLLVSVPAVCILCWKLKEQSHPPASVLLRRALPASALLILTVAFMAYYDYRVFGNVFTPPYAVNRLTYASAPHFLWQSPRPEPTYRHRVMREFYSGTELAWFLKSRTATGLAGETGFKAFWAESFYFAFTLAVPLVMLPRVLRDRRIRPLLLLSGIFVAGLAVETWFIPHYAAPFTAGLYAILLQCMRHLRVWRPAAAHQSGLFLVTAIPVICLLLAGIRVYADPLHVRLSITPTFTWYGGTRPFGPTRKAVLKVLQTLPGGQLVIVRYSGEHNVPDEWVYNAADVDKAKVVWARDMGCSHDRELIRYFRTRNPWLLEPDFKPPRLSHYPLKEFCPETARENAPPLQVETGRHRGDHLDRGKSI